MLLLLSIVLLSLLSWLYLERLFDIPAPVGKGGKGDLVSLWIGQYFLVSSLLGACPEQTRKETIGSLLTPSDDDDDINDRRRSHSFGAEMSFQIDSLTSEADRHAKREKGRHNLQMSLSFCGAVDVAMVAW